MRVLLLCISFIMFCLIGCRKEIKTIDIIELNVDPIEIIGDNSSVATITATLNPDADDDKRTVIFNATNGSFIDGEGTTISKTAEKFNDSLIAIAKLTAPLVEGVITISAEVDIKDLKGIYVSRVELNILKSEPATITLTANSLSVVNDFDEEIKLTAKIKNSAGNSVILNTAVSLEDFDQDFNEIEGYFRDEKLNSNELAQENICSTSGWRAYLEAAGL